ncbi:UrcA family protein [Sphingomonas sp. CFBP 13720]|uniref:UrcA family protein n=1 Tax=Sphingomonas sp. CFBP 13720 TaxID=2775302 RepID=UPI00177D6518|nr:UrcA family protein [Sphingomonas sp. CFBP 13720]MBD8677210.1 UrcA family protein [Sphingomonas sp. CFBP 13720]
MTTRFAALAAVALCLTSTAHAQVREPVTIRVSYAGLDLTSASGRAMLDARIDRASRYACRSALTGLPRAMDEARCRTEMRDDARVRVAQLQSSRAREVASAQ